jgi:hypothetical protein
MEFNFYISKALNIDQEGVCILDANKYNARSGFRSSSISSTNYGQRVDPAFDGLSQILDRMGEASSKV